MSEELKAQLLKNLQRLKNEFDISDLNLPQDSLLDTITKKIQECDPKTDIRAFVQGHIDLLTVRWQQFLNNLLKRPH